MSEQLSAREGGVAFATPAGQLLAGWLAGWVAHAHEAFAYVYRGLAWLGSRAGCWLGWGASVALRHILQAGWLAFRATSLCCVPFAVLHVWCTGTWPGSVGCSCACCLFIMNFIFSIELSRATAGRVSLSRLARFRTFSAFILLFASQCSLYSNL